MIMESTFVVGKIACSNAEKNTNEPKYQKKHTFTWCEKYRNNHSPKADQICQQSHGKTSSIETADQR